MQAVKCLVKFATALLMCSCGSSSQMVCRATFNSSIVLDFSWSLWNFSRCDSPVGSNLQSLGATDSFQWTQDSSLTASTAWHASCELGHSLDGRWSLDCLYDCSANDSHLEYLQIGSISNNNNNNNNQICKAPECQKTSVALCLYPHLKHQKPAHFRTTQILPNKPSDMLKNSN